MAWLCDALDVSRSGFHAWLNRSPSARFRHDEVLVTAVDRSFKSSDRTYGARRVWHDVLAEGLSCGLHRIERLMRENGLRARPRRRGLPKTKIGAGVVDLFSRRVVGWAMKAEMTAQLVADALIMAIWRRGRPDSLLHHSDQGSQGTQAVVATPERRVLRRPLKSGGFCEVRWHGFEAAGRVWRTSLKPD